MAISVEPVILLPTMDSERFERCAFSLQDRESLLTVHLAELPPFVIHFHGLRLNSEMDGAANHNDIVRSGESFEYRFVPRDAGVFWYHPHVRSDEQIERGLFGVLIVRDRPRDAGTGPAKVVVVPTGTRLHVGNQDKSVTIDPLSPPSS